jgi:hypothetical protein
MGIPKSYPIRFTPKGLSDAFDATDTFPGACQTLQNLVFDQANPELITARPGVGAAFTSFPGAVAPIGFVSLHFTLGTLTFGMLSTGRNPGNDEPFCYNNATNTFIGIAGVTAGNTPTSPGTTGAWTPPTAAVIGIKIIITHPGFSGVGANFFGVIDITNIAAPTWTAANLATNPLPAVPTSVANFNNRAYYSFGNKLFYSDVLVPLTATNAGQSLTVGDNTAITAQAGLPVQTTSSGIVGALVVFKPSQIWQVTGDAAVTTNPLSQNYLTLNVGCISPRSIVPTSFGLAFIGIAGPFFLSPLGAVLPLNSKLSDGSPADLQAPFQNTTSPTRIAAGFQGNIYRVCVPTLTASGAATNDYWYDLYRRRWSGPHTFPYDCISAVSGATSGSYFLLSTAAHPGALYRGLAQPQAGITPEYDDLGVPLQTVMQSSSFPKTGHMAEKQVVESTIELSSTGASVSYNISALNSLGNIVGNAAVTTQNIGGLWGSNVWGDGTLWASPKNTPSVYTVPWSAPVVFKKFSLNIQATAVNSLSIGTFYARYQDCGYTLME